ncbi:unnamed protein product, partial [Larinioides sclopetarius]
MYDYLPPYEEGLTCKEVMGKLNKTLCEELLVGVDGRNNTSISLQRRQILLSGVPVFPDNTAQFPR